MLKYMEELSPGEASNIKKTIQDLFKQTCILQVKCDPVTLVQRDNPRYRTCANHREFIAAYLSLLDLELIHDPQEQLFRIQGEGLPTERMNLMTTRIMLLLKIIYRDRIMGDGLRATVTSLREIREYGASTKLIIRKLTSQEWQDVLVYCSYCVMSNSPILISIGNVEDDTPIYIYSTVNIFCSSVTIEELVKKYRDRTEAAIDGTTE